MLTLDRHGAPVRPDFPYQCSCGSAFKMLSGMLEHKRATGHY